MKYATLTLLLAASLAGCSGNDPGGSGLPEPPLGEFVEAPCNFQSARPVTCGYVTVREARAGAPSGKTVRLWVGIFKSDSPTPAPDSLVFLQGGPGGASVSFIAGVAGPVGSGSMDSVFARRDIIAIDQRGTGKSQPALGCPELGMVTPPTGGGMNGMMMMDGTLALQKCHDRLVASGVALDEYTTSAAADDVEDVRRALGKSQWNVLGGSYGTRLALELIRRHPAGLRSVILDSVLPPDVDLLGESPVHYATALEGMFAACAAQPACDASYPGLRSVFIDIIAKLNATPALGKLDGTMFTMLIAQRLKVPLLVADVPELVFQARDNKFDSLGLSMDSQSSGNEQFSEGLHFSVTCADYFPFTSRAAIEMRASEIAAELRPGLLKSTLSYLETCPVWNVRPSDRAVAEPVTSDRQTLALAGAIDPATPPVWTRHAAQSLSAAQYLEFKGTGHGVFLTPCGRAASIAFLEDPNRKPAPACLADLLDVQFHVQR